MSRIKHIGFWGVHIARHAPELLVPISRLAIQSRVAPHSIRPKLLVATHHKALTVFLGRVFKCFAVATARSLSQGRGEGMDYSADVLFDTHSEFLLEKLHFPYVGIHIRRDPRDLLVSSVFYHQRADERWLHRPLQQFEGRTYQQQICSLSNMEEKLIFELEHSAGRNIRDMLRWRSSRPCGFTELTYEELVGPQASDVFSAVISEWPVSALERTVLLKFFEYFSLAGAGAIGNKHMRNPSVGQWREHFTPRIEACFSERFPSVVTELGYTD